LGAIRGKVCRPSEKTVTPMKPLEVILVGFGAIGRAIYQRLQANPGCKVSAIVVRTNRIEALQTELGTTVAVVDAVPSSASLVIECAGHEALKLHVLPALRRGVECAVLSVGALSEIGLPEALEESAGKGSTQVHLLSGAIGGIDAIAAAQIEGIDKITYTGRKPPAGWKGSAAENLVVLDSLREPTVFFEGNARQAAKQYPKNSNVAATIALAGVGLDETVVRLIADPSISDNIHEIEVHGAFGMMQLTMKGKPLADNPRTSALTVLSALRFLHNKAQCVTI
jgi:aspartate dehydrogenase